MDFSEKFSALLSLTATKNVTLARAINIDTAQISRMKTGVRRMPVKPNLLREISGYLAGQFDSEYRLSALYELTSDVRLQMNITESALSNIIYDWLVSPNSAPQSQASRFLDRFGSFSMQDLKESLPESDVQKPAFGHTGFVSYCNNSGKRQAPRDLIAFILALDAPCTIRVFTDERLDWIYEDSSFIRELAGYVGQVVQKGCKIQRVRPPDQNTESVFRSMERWLPAYMAGALKLFYYPWTRDELHRRTMVIVPGHIAMHSDSLAGQRECPMTILTTDPKTVQLTDEHYSRILQLCRPMMSVYTPDTSIKPMVCLEALAKIEDFGVYKSSMLSVHTMPVELLDLMRQRGTLCAQKMCDCYERSISPRAKVLERHTIMDIICLPDLEQVMNGTAVIPGTKISPSDCLFYRPEEYRLHLEHILWYLQNYPNYEAVLLDEPLFENITLFVKGDSYAILIKETDPFALFEITERTLASSLCEYLRHLMKDKVHLGSRQETMDHLRKELRRLDRAIRLQAASVSANND